MDCRLGHSGDMDVLPGTLPPSPESVHLRTLRDVVAYAKEMDARRATPSRPAGPARERQQSRPSYWLGLIYESRSGNMLAEEDFACVAELEDAAFHPDFFHADLAVFKLTPKRAAAGT